MKIGNTELNIKQIVFLILYYAIFQYLPSSTTFLIGTISKKMRYYCCKKIFKKCGSNVNIERKAFFGTGSQLEIGNNSGLGVNCHIPSNIIIGCDVMMGQDCYIIDVNHKFDLIDVPIRKQGASVKKVTLIEDDVWIGRDVLITAGRHIKKGTVIAAKACVTKDFPEYSIIGGNPATVIKSRK